MQQERGLRLKRSAEGVEMLKLDFDARKKSLRESHPDHLRVAVECALHLARQRTLKSTETAHLCSGGLKGSQNRIRKSKTYSKLGPLDAKANLWV